MRHFVEDIKYGREITEGTVVQRDDLSVQVCRLPDCKRRCDGLLKWSGRDAGKREYQYERGSPSTCSDTYARIKLVEIGAI